MLNLTCPVVTLTHSEFQILSNGSVQYTGSNLDYLGHVFDDFEITENHSAIVCALQHDKGNEDLISGAYQGYLTVFCLSISIICLVLHIATYCALPKLCNLPGKNLLSLSWALLFAQLLFLVGINPIFEVPLGVCIGIAVVEHYCFLAAFFWMNVMSVDIWRTFSRSTLRGNGGMKTHCKFAGYAWGSSAFIAFVAMSVDFCTEDGAVKPSFGTGQVCWFGNRGGLGLFLAMPLFVILMVNSGLFANTVYKIWQAQLQGKRYIRDRTRDELIQSSCNSTNMKATIHKRKDDSGITSRKDKIRFYLYLKLFTIMGLTWIFGFIAAFAHVTFLWYPFIVFNGLQGTFIFVMFDMKRNIACMLWDKYVSQYGYQPPRFLLARSSSSTTRSTVSSKIKSRDSASGSDKTHSTATTRTISTASDPHLTLTIT
ncbi:G-protein coupled receptor Mth2 [Zootermopsis nevadensis]|uniref:G-protein coupled receptor Mth2 n=2 Tax=Zootermopsis nevadensis TaxID=136037 RepID=A0A067QNB6_ZOONE|nr:G-protein coupled receptor Mth2 [Zootermopsis nevadensis]